MSETPYVGGILNMSGARPETAFDFPDPIFPKQVCYIMKFTSNYEAIEKLILPPPLKVDRSQPPEVILWYFASPESRGPGGQTVPYQGFQFRGYTEFNGVKGIAGWEYVDGLRGDKTGADVMGPWGVQFGMMKKFADIRFTPLGGDEFEIVATRQGHQVLKMTIGSDQQIDRAELDQLLASGDNPMFKETFTVREIPNCDWSGYVDRSVLSTPTARSLAIHRAWHANRGTIEFGHDGLHSLDALYELHPTDVQALMIGEMQTGKSTFKDMKVVAKLS